MNVMAGSLRSLFDRVDERVVGLMFEYGVLAVRVPLRIVSVWFGLLEVTRTSPIYYLAANARSTSFRRSPSSRSRDSGR